MNPKTPKFKVGQIVIYEDNVYKFRARVLSVDRGDYLTVSLIEALNNKSKRFTLPMTHRDSLSVFSALRKDIRSFVVVNAKNLPDAE